MKKLQIHRALLVGFLSLAGLLMPLHLAYSQDATVTLYDNITGFNPPSYAYTQVYSYMVAANTFVQQRLAYSFSTGNFSGTLSSVVLLMHAVKTMHAFVDIYGDGGGSRTVIWADCIILRAL